MNPVIAVLLGATLAHEPVTQSVLIGAGVIVASVVLITLAPRRRPVPERPAGEGVSARAACGCDVE